MKKIIILILFLFFVTACYDYSEINDLAIISAIGIDYDEGFNLTYEILNDKSSQMPQSPKAYIVSGNGSTLANAVDNITLKISKIPYYYHIKAIVIDENIAKDHMKELVDYFVRASDIRNEFYLLVCHECNSKDIFHLASDNVPVIADNISQLIQTSKFNYNASYSKPFEDVMEKMVNDKTDAITTSIKIANNSIAVAGIAVFKNYTYKEYIDNDKSTFLNLLLEEKSHSLMTIYYDNKPFSINIDFSKIKYEVNNNKITIKIVCEGLIKENGPNFDLKKETIYQKLNNDFNSLLKDNLISTLTIMKDKDVDILGLKDLYYKKYHKEINVLNDIEISFNTEMRINKKGLIFGVTNEK